MRNISMSIVMATLLFTGCGGSGCCTGDELAQTKSVSGGSVDEPNKTPIAIITNLPTHVQECSNIEASAELSNDLDGMVESYEWSIDGNNISQGQNISTILPCENNQTNFQVCLNVTDNEGAISITTCQIVNIVSEDEKLDIEDSNDTVEIEDSNDTVEIEDSNDTVEIEDSNDTVEDTTDSDDVVQNIEIPLPSRDWNAHVFDVCDQTFDGHEVKSYYWQITKYDKNGVSFTHTNKTCKKRIFATDDKEFKVDVTLTITFTDGQSRTTTNSYILNDNVQKLD